MFHLYKMGLNYLHHQCSKVVLHKQRHGVFARDLTFSAADRSFTLAIGILLLYAVIRAWKTLKNMQKHGTIMHQLAIQIT